MQQRKMKPLFAIALVVICLLGLSALYFYNYSMVREKNHFPDLSVTAFQLDGVQHVRVSGSLKYDSSLAVYSVSERRRSSSITIIPHVFVVSRISRNGRIDYDVVVPSSVSDIRFGNKETIIWQRSQ